MFVQIAEQFQKTEDKLSLMNQIINLVKTKQFDKLSELLEKNGLKDVDKTKNISKEDIDILINKIEKNIELLDENSKKIAEISNSKKTKSRRRKRSLYNSIEPMDYYVIQDALKELDKELPIVGDKDYIKESEWKELEQFLDSEIQWYAKKINVHRENLKNIADWFRQTSSELEQTGIPVIDGAISIFNVFTMIFFAADAIEPSVREIYSILPYMGQEYYAIKNRMPILKIRALTHIFHKYINKEVRGLLYTWLNNHQNNLINRVKKLIKISRQRYIEDINSYSNY